MPGKFLSFGWKEQELPKHRQARSKLSCDRRAPGHCCHDFHRQENRLTEAIYIQANANQWIAARVAKFAVETRGRARERGIPVALMNVNEMPCFKAFTGATIRSGPLMTTYDPGEVQSFTLSRFMPPELMGYSGRALVLDPDVFALADVGELLATDLRGNAIAACPRADGWESQRHAARLRQTSPLEHRSHPKRAQKPHPGLR